MTINISINRFLALSALVIFPIISADAKPPKGEKTIKKVLLVSGRAPDEGDWFVHGNVYLLYSNGKKVRQTTNGLCAFPHMADDGRTVGWIEGRTMMWDQTEAGKKITTPTFVHHRIVVFRAGYRVCSVTPEAYGRVGGTEICIFSWRFSHAGRHIEVLSQVSHGPDYYQLFDARTGKQLERADVGLDKVPTWANGLPHPR